MTRLRQLSLLTIIGSASFVFAFVAKRTRQAPAASTTRAALPAGAPDSVRLAAMGIKQGPQLVAYVFGGSRCGYCKRPETKAAYASLRRLLRQNNEGTFRSVSVVGVAINTDLREGLQYLQSIGDSSFDEISVGKGWLNEHVERLIWRNPAHAASVPQVIVLSRSMTAEFGPRSLLSMKFGTDSIVKIVVGYKALLDWVHGGASLAASVAESPAPAEQSAANTSRALGAERGRGVATTTRR